MPKKFQGENSKAATARARKAEAMAVADARKKKEEEDRLWQETDKHVLKKEQRKVRSVFTLFLSGFQKHSQRYTIIFFVIPNMTFCLCCKVTTTSEKLYVFSLNHLMGTKRRYNSKLIL